MDRLWWILGAAVLAGLMVMSLAGCAGTAQSGRVEVGKGGTAGNIETGARAASQAPQLDRTEAQNLNVDTTYSALDRNVARMGMVAGAVIVALLAVALAADGPADSTHKMYLFAAGGAALAAAFVMGYLFFA